MKADRDGHHLSGGTGCCGVVPAEAWASRRAFLTGAAAAFGLGTAMASIVRAAPGRAETAASAERRLIDVHHHIIPPFYLAENRDRIAGSRGGQISPAWLGWR